MAGDDCDVRCLAPSRARELRAQSISAEEALEIAVRLRAIADPMRLRIAAALRDGQELCVCDLSWVCEASVALVSHHLKALREAGLVDRTRDGRLMMYRLADRGLPLLQVAFAEDAA